MLYLSMKYGCGMRVKTSVTLPEELLADIADVAGPGQNRSAFVEAAVRAYVSQRRRDARDERELAIINANADRLNEEAADVLDFQAVP